MVRKFINWLTALCGWSPVGKAFKFYSGEGPSADALTNATGLVVGLGIEPSGPAESIFMSLDGQITLENGDVTTELILVPRHKNYGASALATTFICVYVLPGGGEIFDRDNIIAIMDVGRLH